MNIRSIAGQQAEKAVAEYLMQQGFTILQFNYRRTYGEIDLIAKYRSTVAFVEVKMRNNDLVPMTQLVNWSKQQKIIAVAKDFITRNYKICGKAICRFDIALIFQNYGKQQITYIPNAFSESESSAHDYY